MKIRLGTLTGTMSDVAGDGIYLSDAGRDVRGVEAIYYGVKDGVAVKLWPGEGVNRIISLRLVMDETLAVTLTRYAEATDDFKAQGSYLRLTVGERSWMRNPTRTDIAWDAATLTLSFLNNVGPMADKILRGDYVQLEAGMSRWTQRFTPTENEPQEELTRVGYFRPVTDCTVYVAADWYRGSVQCAAGVMQPDASWLLQAQGQEAAKKKKKRGGTTRYGQELQIDGVTGGPYAVYLKGYAERCGVQVTYPANSMACSGRVVEVRVKE